VRNNRQSVDIDAAFRLFSQPASNALAGGNRGTSLSETKKPLNIQAFP
jgi:hypothetical protein